MSDDKLKRVALALKRLGQEKDLEETLVLDLTGLLEILALDLQFDSVPMLESGKNGRVFSLWEQTILSADARNFLLSALYTEVITPLELEQALTLAFTQLEDYAGVEEMCGFLESVVQDHKRVSLFTNHNLEYVH